MTTLNRSNEINIIAYSIPNSNDYIIAKTDSVYVVMTSDGPMEYSESEMKEIYNIDFSKSHIERAGWVA